MDRCIDLTDGDNGPLLTQTETDGLLTTRFLTDAPLETYLEAAETPLFLLRNTRRGLAVEGDGPMDPLTPNAARWAFALVTDTRVRFVVGRASGDRAQSVHLRDVIQASAESTGLLTSELVLDTEAGQTLRFPVRGDIAPVASAIDEAAQGWAGAVRRIERAAERLDAAGAHLADRDFGAALDEMNAVGELLSTAESLAAEIGSGPAGVVERGTRAARRSLEARRRRAYAGRGAAHHATGQEAWADHDFEAAAAAYDRAVADYEKALSHPGPDPDEAALAARDRGARVEREILRAGPLVAAETAIERAESLSDPEAAATTWETALDRLHRAMGLIWPGEDRDFAASTAHLRERAAAATEAAIDERRRAARRWFAAGDRIAAEGDTTEAADAYRLARPHLERALTLARELFPDRLAQIREERSRLAARLADEPGPPGDDRVDAPLPPTAQTRLSLGGRASEPDAAPEDRERELRRRHTTRQRVLGDLDEAGLREVVADLWRHEGWATTVLSTRSDAGYHVVGTRGDPPERLLIWVLVGATPVGPETVDRVVRRREATAGADRAAIVATAAVEPAARSAAADAGVTVLDREELLERLAAASLADRVAGAPA